MCLGKTGLRPGAGGAAGPAGAGGAGGAAGPAGAGGAAIWATPIMVLCIAGGTFAADPGAGGAFSAGGGAMGLNPIMVFFPRLSVARPAAPGTLGVAVVRAGASGLAIGAPH
jgi:hypothetical protein